MLNMPQCEQREEECEIQIYTTDMYTLPKRKEKRGKDKEERKIQTSESFKNIQSMRIITVLYSVFHFQVFKMSLPKPACREFSFWPSAANKCTQVWAIIFK